MGKSRRDGQYRDLQARLKVLQEKVGDASSLKTIREGQALWEKVRLNPSPSRNLADPPLPA